MNDTTRWIMIILLLLLIGAAVFMLLRSPGKDNGNELRRTDSDRDGVADAQETRAVDTARPERDVYDQAAEDRTTAASDEAPPAAYDEAPATTAYDDAPATAYDDAPATGYDEAPADAYEETPAAHDEAPPADYDDDDDDRRQRMTGAAQIGAMGAAGAAGAAASRTADPAVTDQSSDLGTAAPVDVAPDETGYEPSAGASDVGATTYADDAATGETYRGDAATYPETDLTDDSTYVDETSRPMTDSSHDAGYATDTAAYRDESAAYTGEAGTEVHPLSDEEVEEGARTEPLTADEVVAASDQGGRTDLRDPETVGGTDEEYPVGDDTTTYRADNGDAVALGGTTGVDSPAGGQTYTQDTLYTADDDARAGGTVAGSVDAPAEETSADTGSDTDTRGWDSGAGAGAGAGTFAEAAYGPGSAEPLEDGSGPAGWEVKGNAGSMLFHTPDSPSYDAVRAEVWFESEEAARNAGFAHWDRRRR